MQRILLIDNPLEPASWERLEVEDVRALLVERYAEWPAGARIYRGLQIGDDRDVTPATQGDVEALASFPELTVVIFPEGPALLIAALVVAVVATVALMFLLPSIPDLSNQQTQSPNNALAERQNRPRPGARIPDIFGQVRAIPDLIGVPYRVYEDHRELEIAFMCIGRGSYEIADVRDGDTLVENIQGASCAIYGPGTSPNSGDAPQLQIGPAIGDPLFNVARLNEVNGQVLKAPNDEAVRADKEISFADGGIVQASGGQIDFTDYFEAGDTIEIGKAVDTGEISDPSAIFAAARGLEGGSFIFDTFDPSVMFAPGQTVVIQHATYVSPDAPPGGDIVGNEINPKYPYLYNEREIVQ